MPTSLDPPAPEALPSRRKSSRLRDLASDSSVEMPTRKKRTLSHERTSPVDRDFSTEGSRSGYLLRCLKEDGTFYLAGEARPRILVRPVAYEGDGGNTGEGHLAELQDMKNEIREVSVRIIDELAPLSFDHPESYDQINVFTNAHGHFARFRDVLGKITQAADNRASSYSGKSTRLRRRADQLESLRRIVEGDVEAQNYVFRETLNYLEHKPTHPDHVLDIRRLAASQRTTLNEIKDAGAACRKRATLLGVKRLSPETVAKLTNKPLVETKKLAELGKLHGVFTDSDSEGEANYIQLEGKGFYRICAPSTDDLKHTTAVIFWEKDDDEDNTPTGDKIIGAVVYSPDLISKAFSPDHAYSEAENLVNQEFLLTKANVDRQRLVNGGKMAKGRGAQSIYGMPYTMKLPDDQHFYDGNVQIPIQAGEPVMEARHEAFVQGFLPEFAALRQSAAHDANLINQLGYPSTSTFATYGYAASAHLDKDACPTSGWVTHRPQSLDRFTSNFVWVSHGVVVELATNAFWFWKARDHEHGTTVHEGLLADPQLTYSKGYIKRHTDGAQWTRVSVLSEAVCKAHSRR